MCFLSSTATCVAQKYRNGSVLLWERSEYSLKFKELSRQSEHNFLFFFLRFSVLYNMFQLTWPSSGNIFTTMYEILGRKLSS
jgi:hypothetical protein